MKNYKKLVWTLAVAVILVPVTGAFAAEAPQKAEEKTQEKAPMPLIREGAEEGAKADESHAPGQHSAGGGEHQEWHFQGMFGTYDRAALQRGYKVYREVCASCHSMKRVYFRNLEALGYDEGQVKNIASQYNITDGPNDEGEMYERPGLPSDHFVSPFPNDNAAKFANGGALPPDLSLIVKARHHGPDYVYGILTGYEPAPANVTLLPGQNWNTHMPGNIIAMPKPLADGQVVYEDDAPQTAGQYARDVTEFLAWAGDPYMEDRKRTGVSVIIFLTVFMGIMYAWKRRLWSSVH